MIKCVFDKFISDFARQIEKYWCVATERWNEVEAQRVQAPAPLQDRSEVNLDLSLRFILELFVSFFCGTSAAQWIKTGRIQKTSSLHVCICTLSWGRQPI